ncbi:MAG: hypothetical protein M1347_06175 [Chloroflexi bacterium]|nr:hypothetical protein [Chloroflexota bacterium]
MLFLGVLSVFQLLLFPGLLLIRLFPGRRGFIQNFVYVFMLSLLANYAVVFVLVSIGLYLRAVVLPLFILQVAALLWIYRKSLVKILDGSGTRIKSSIPGNLKSFADWVKRDFWSASLYFVFGTLAILGLIWVFWIWVSNFNTVFQTWDAWASWDRWAVKWAGNHFPDDTWEYPQLIPVSYSLAYKFIGTTAVKFFGKSIMPLFALIIGLMLFDLGKKFKSFGYMLGAGLALYSINLFLGKYLPEGYVDIPVACFSLMAVYTLLSTRQQTNKQGIRSALLLGSLSTAAAAVTKQPGLYIMAFYPVLAYFWVLRGNKIFKGREAFFLLGKHFLLVLVLVVPWYAYMEYRIILGANTSNIQYVITDIYKGQTLPERFMAAVDGLGSYVYFYVFALLSLLVLDNRFRQLFLLVILPFSILWAFFLSYEGRNLAVALPLLSMTVGVSAEEWLLRLRGFWVNRPRLLYPAFAVLLIGLVALGAGTLALNDERIIQRQISQQRQIFEPTLNDKLYKYFSRAEGPEPVITSYPIGWLPDLEGLWINERFQDYATYQKTLLNNPSVTLLLVPAVTPDQRIIDEIWLKVDSGTYQVIFTEANYVLIRIPPR